MSLCDNTDLQNPSANYRGSFFCQEKIFFPVNSQQSTVNSHQSTVTSQQSPVNTP
ncbi:MULTISPECIES: hypothetical protein [Calothrix]|uniref:Uncharacterized protein n=2 Tax=Calothrix TaxID=1186 RepID=A0ABR8A365_9CYAN|nr:MULTISPECIES: hypothetical protein [Calothrix]MBD2194244.1 hypothetical protein [Calothrix parietina FACHB-288]MBD2225040.1 hypothetical protein [Calothrix anomala FACHB-343]